MLRANVPGAIISGSNPPVTLTASGTSAVILSNGIVSITCQLSDAYLTQIAYTYNNGNGTKTTQMLNGGTDGGQFYIGTGDYGGFGGSAPIYSVVVNPATGDAHHAAGDYGEIDLLSTSSTNGTVDIHFSMLRGSPGFYVTAAWAHRAQDLALVQGESRTNVYAGSIFNWMSVDPGRNKMMAVNPNNTSIPVPGAPPECYLWTSGIYQGRYDDKYKYSADFSDQQFAAAPGPQRVWGWSSVGTSSTYANVGMWDVNASSEYHNCGPMKRENMCHIGTTILNVLNGDHYAQGLDANFATGEVWNKVYGPYFVYCNNVSTSITDPYQASQALYNDALAQGVAEASGTPSATGTMVGATAWPYGWFYYNNSYGTYTHAAGRGTVTGRIVISDSGNPTASGSNLYVGVVEQPPTSVGVYDFQYWAKPYEFWVQADGNGNFTVPNVIAGNNYTLYAFGPGAEGELMSQNQTGGNPPILYNLPATQFSVAVTGGSTTDLGTITWTPARLGATVFEIGYPDRTSRKFRHGDDYWVGDIGASPTAPAPVWTKFLEYPFDFPNGMTYTVGSSRWTTDWDFVQPVMPNSAGDYIATTGTISFNLATAPAAGATASLYLGLASNDGDATIVSVNGNNLGSTAGVTAEPNAEASTGYYSPYGGCDTTVREGNNALYSDERLTFPVSLLNAGTNNVTIGFRETGGADNPDGYFADHIMYDYIRLELSGYVPPAPGSVAAYAGNNSILLSWPVTPGATSYNIGRSTTSGNNYSAIATGVLGPVCGSGLDNDTWLDTTATNGTTYYYVVQSVNTTGTSANSTQSSGVAPSSGTAASPPSAPTLTASAGNAEVMLNWTASPGANYYVIARSTLVNNGGTFAGTLANSSEMYNTLGTITLTNTAAGPSYIDTTTNNNCIYAYTVTPVNASGTGAASAAVNAVPVAPAPTVAPTVTASPGDEQVTLTWGAVPGAVGYLVEVATAPGGPYTLLASVTELTYADTGLNDNTPYYFEVLATSSGGSSGSSNVASATTALSAPTILTATPGNTQVTLNWSAVAGATSYAVERSSVTGGPYTQIGTSDGTSYTDDNLTNGTAYYYVVASTSTNGTGPVSVEASATPNASVPVAPAGLTAIPGNAQVALNWTASAGATSYVVQEATTSGGPYSVLNGAVTSTTYTATGLGNGTAYYYVVAATGTGGTGANSNEVSATPNSNVNLTWRGAVSTAWDTVTANWEEGGDAIVYTDGSTVTFDDTAETSNVVMSGSYNPASVTCSNSILNYVLSGSGPGMIGGDTGLVKTGSASLILAGSNTFTGPTTILGGTLSLGNADALLESTLNYNNQGGTLGFGALTSATLGGIEGAQALSLTNTNGAGVALAVGNDGQNTSYSGVLSGSAGFLTMIGAGTLTLSGSGSNIGALTTSGGIVSIGTGAAITSSTANITSGQLQINGGTLTCSAASNITAGSGGLVVNSGTASFDGGLTSSYNVDNNIFIGVAGGSLNMASLNLGRTALVYSSEPTAGSATTGLYVNGGVAAITGTLNVCGIGGSNSSDSVRIDSGALTVGSTTIITLNNGSRWSVLDVNGGTFACDDATGPGIQLGGVYTSENGILLVRNGMAYTNKISFGDMIQTSGTDVLNVTGGVLYVGSGGIVLGGPGAYTYGISLSGTGTLGALAGWSSALNITLAGGTIQAGDNLGNAQNITLTGAVTGSTLKKTGNGTLLIGGSCALTGSATVSAGILEISGSLTGTTSLTIANGASVYLAGGLLSVSGSITNNGIFKISGTPALSLTGRFINNGVLDLINGPSSLPPNYVNNGTVLNAGNVAVQQASLAGTAFSVTVQSYVEHTYQLQRSNSLTNPSWANIGSARAGTGSTLEFTDPGAIGTQGFYQVEVSP